jgi:hypothetical protein
MHHQVKGFQIEVIQPLTCTIDVPGQGIISILRLIGMPTPEVIKSKATEIILQFKNQVPVKEGPGGISMNHDNRCALADIHVVHGAT